jgi:hypothetical protein
MTNGKEVLQNAIGRICNYWKLEDRTKDQISNNTDMSLVLVSMYVNLSSLVGDTNENHREWLRSFNRRLNGKPATLMQNEQGFMQVADYLVNNNQFRMYYR